MSSQNLQLVLEAFFEADALNEVPERGATRHPLRTDACPPLTRFPEGVAGGWTDAERSHVGDCVYCRKVLAMQNSFLRPKAVSDAVREGRSRAAAALAAAAPPELRDKLATWIREQVDFLAASVRVMAGAPLSLALSLEAVPVLAQAAALESNEPSKIHEVGGPYGYTMHIDGDEVCLLFTGVRRSGKPPNVFLSASRSALDSKYVPAQWDDESNVWMVRFGSPGADYIIVITPGY